MPQGITNRPKEGFVLPIFDWMVEKLKDYSMDVLSEKRLKKHHLLNLEGVRDILESYYSGNRGNAGKVWNLMMFQIWWEKYFGT
jgi:asparagine synthase (glutamine-hydrolysing)